MREKKILTISLNNESTNGLDNIFILLILENKSKRINVRSKQETRTFCGRTRTFLNPSDRGKGYNER